MSYRMDRRAYAETYGPTVGDRPTPTSATIHPYF
jgi:urease alpha subunit